MHYVLPDRLRQEQRENCHKALEKTRDAREKQSLMYAKLKPLSPSKAAGKVSGSSGKLASSGHRASGGWHARQGRQGRAAVRTAVAEETQASIDSFEARLMTMPTSGAEATQPSFSPQQATVTTSEPPTAGTVS